MHSSPHSCACHLGKLFTSFKVTATRVGRWKHGGDTRQKWEEARRGAGGGKSGTLGFVVSGVSILKSQGPPWYIFTTVPGSPLRTNKRKLKDSCFVCILIPGLQEIFHYPNSEAKHPSFINEMSPCQEGWRAWWTCLLLRGVCVGWGWGRGDERRKSFAWPCGSQCLWHLRTKPEKADQGL